MPPFPPASSSTSADFSGGVRPSFSPLYEQIKELILQGLQAGEWKPGEAIPSEIELAARYQVSQGTVRKAVDALAKEFLLVRRQGKGTYVASHAIQHVKYRFLRLTPDDGRAGGMVRRFLDCRRLRPPADVGRMLELKSGEAALLTRRVLDFHGRPVIFDEIWLPASLFKGLTLERLSAYEGPTYGLFETEFGVRPIRAEEKIRAVLADDTTAEVLAVDAGAPLLSVERLTRTYADRPVELRRGYYDTSSHYYRNELG